MTTNLKDLESRIEKLMAENAEFRKSQEQANARFMAQGGNPYSHNEKSMLMAVKAKNLREAMTKNLGESNVPALYKAHLLELKKDLMIARAFHCITNGINDVEKWDSDQGIKLDILDNDYAKYVDLENRIKAFGTGVAGEGLEWVPTIIASTYIEEYELEKMIHAEFRQINMPAQSYEHPIHKNRTTARSIGENVEATGTSFGTDVIPFSAKKLFEYYPISDELTVESAPNILSLAQSEVIQSQIRAYDAMIISGDTAGTHQDSDVTAANDCRKLIDGLRKRAIANSANGVVIDAAGPITETVLKLARAAMGRYAVRPSELAWIPSPISQIQMDNLTNVSTVDKIGNDRATVRHGHLSQYQGIPIMVSEDMRDDLNASGVYDGVTTDKGSLLLVNRTRFMFAKRRPIRVRAARDPRPELDRFQLVSYSRVDWNGFEQDANEKSVAYVTNISLS